MNKKNIENKIKNAFEAVTPAKLDDVLGCCAEQMAENREKKAPVTVPLLRRNRVRWAQAGALALVAICVSTAFILNGRRANEVVIGSTETGNTESVIATHTDSSSESVYVTESESDSTADTTLESTDEPVSEPSSATEPNTEPDTEPPVYTEPIVEPTESPVTEPAEDTGNGVTDATESTGIEEPVVVGEYIPENKSTDTFAGNAVENPGHSENCGCSPDEVCCPVPDPVYRGISHVFEHTWDLLREKLGEDNEYYYLRYDELQYTYAYSRLGAVNGEDAYYVTVCVAGLRIDCIAPVAYASEIKDIKISPLTVSGISDGEMIGEAKARKTALDVLGVRESAVRSLNVSLDRYKSKPSYLVSFYYNGMRYTCEIDAANGAFVSGTSYDLAPLNRFVEEKFNGPDYDYKYEKRNVITRDTGIVRIPSFSVYCNDEYMIYDVSGDLSYDLEMTQRGGIKLFFEAEGAILLPVSRNDERLDEAMEYIGIWNEDILYFEREKMDEETVEIRVGTDKHTYKFGLHNTWNSEMTDITEPGAITYFGKAPVGAENGIKPLTAESVLNIALEHAGVEEYTLASIQPIKYRSRSMNPIYVYYHDITFTSGDHKYIYRIDAVTGEILRYFSGSGKGDVSDVVYTITDRSGFSKKDMDVLCNAVKREFAPWFDGCKLEEIWYDDAKLYEIDHKYTGHFVRSYGVVLGIRFTTDADYEGPYDFEANTKYSMYCVLYNNIKLARWEAIDFVFE